MKNILITGGAGFIGSNFCHYFLAKNRQANIVNLDLLTYAGSLANLEGLEGNGHYKFCQGDICDVGLVNNLFKNHQFDTVVHFAAESHVDRSISSPATFIRTNIQGTFTLLEAARNLWQADGSKNNPDRRFHHISTDEVFGTLDPKEPAFTETTAYKPNSPYAASKASSDHLVRAYQHTYDLPTTISNCSNNYGPFQFPEKLIPLIITNALDGQPLPIYGDGMQIRDWLYVQDHCEAIALILKEGSPGDTYNVGGDNQPTNLDIVIQICSILDQMLPDSPHRPHSNLITFVKDRPGHDRRYAMNIEKISSELGWKPKHDLDTGLEKTVAWYLANSQWLHSIRNRQSYSDWIANHYQGSEDSE